MSNQSKLTTWLLASTPNHLKLATNHPFLAAAGTGKLPKSTLSQWLSQDRLYAQSYIRFIGLLLSKIRLPLSHTAETHSSQTQTQTPEHLAVDVLIDALVNIRTELHFFETTAANYSLDLTPGLSVVEGDTSDCRGDSPSVITRAYIDMFMSAGSPGVTVLEGIAVLWATEVCYLRSWRYAASFLETKDGKPDEDGGALREKFIPNWSSKEFEDFVYQIGNVLDLIAGQIGDSELEDVRDRCLGWWRQVLWLEEQFWPAMN
ncbi:hypothetical protein N7495_007902 [Penicillium taxi]|uniref:uncharacterized protein n=1 Tax=Penicillium taxi TaxID=168475 RepID=UPI00254512B2|nr:uncharacterized protein N7495_007902 [Penicillium taxi]KAJ5887861.1 hypothetical protein N7495_007902 [Penicillium taxi]